MTAISVMLSNVCFHWPDSNIAAFIQCRLPLETVPTETLDKDGEEIIASIRLVHACNVCKTTGHIPVNKTQTELILESTAHFICFLWSQQISLSFCHPCAPWNSAFTEGITWCF